MSSYINDAKVFFNDGQGNFVEGQTWYGGVSAMVLADFNGDSNLDVLVGYGMILGQVSQPSQIYLNHGDRTFTAGPIIAGYPTDLRAAAVGDFNGDRVLDVILGNYQQPSQVFWGTGPANILLAGPLNGTDSPGAIHAAVGDFDGNGTLDTLISDWVQSASYILLNDGAGNFSRGYRWSAIGGTFASIGDFNSDGALDVAVRGTVYWNDGHGSFTIGPYIGGVGIVGDFNNDGTLDIASSSIYWNDGHGNFTPGPVLACSGIAAGDFNNDGALDIVGGQVCWNDGQGNFTPGPVLATGVNAVAVSDFNNDGLLDVALVSNRPLVVVYLNDGHGSFASDLIVGNSKYTNAIAVGDLNNDGWMDIVLGNTNDLVYNTAPSQVFLNDGGRGFVASQLLTDTLRVTAVALGDFRGTGTLDIVVGEARTGGLGPPRIRWYWNGNGQAIRLLNNPPHVSVTRPITTADAPFYSTPIIREDMVIPINYSLFDPEGDSVGAVRAYYSLSGGGQWYTATMSSGTVLTNLSTTGSALIFDGIDDYVEIPDSPRLNITDSLTLEAWVNLSDPNNDQKVVGKTPIGSGYLLGVSNGSLYPEIWDASGGWHSFQAGSVPANRWTHLAVTWQTGGDMIGYIDGTPVMTITASGNPIGENANVLRIGSSPWSGPEFVTGMIDDARVYNRALSAAEIRTTMSRELIVTENGLVSNWRFDEGVGATAHDLTVNHNDGVLINGPSWVHGHIPAPTPYVYYWDTFASGFFGQSDNVVFRIEAYPYALSGTIGMPGEYQYPGSVPIYQRPYAFADSLPFRVRGTQVRVLSDTTPVNNALVYRLPQGQSTGAQVMSDSTGKPFRTDWQGYLQGRGQTGLGDRLVALLPITATDTYTLYYTSASPNGTGLTMTTVTTPGVQTLVVSPNNPFILFNLDVSLEWDARNDAQFMSQLKYDLQRTSELLYDWTNGQAALGPVNIYHDREHWLDADIRIYATNRMRPNAAQGGIVSTVITDPVTSTVTYEPGQVRIGAVWNRYGDPGGTLGEDWPRALAHELGHYALFLDDDYLGLDANGLLVPIDTCSNTAMSDPYRDDYSEFHFQTGWHPVGTNRNCEDTLANKSTGRWDWSTVTTFYPWLNGVVANTGPSGLPLAVTQIKSIEPITPSNTLPVPIFYLSQNGGHVEPGPGARAFLFQNDQQLIDLGSPRLDQVTARGAQVGDRLCLFDLAAQRSGCETISPGDDQLTLLTQSNWNPEVILTPVTSRTISIAVTNVPAGLLLGARLYSADGTTVPTITLNLAGNQYAGTFNLDEPSMTPLQKGRFGKIDWADAPLYCQKNAYGESSASKSGHFGKDCPTLKSDVPFLQRSPSMEGYLHLWVEEAEPRREIVTDYSIGGSPAHMRAHWAHMRAHWVPGSSSDGQIILFGRNLTFREDEFVAFQSATTLPSVPAWTTVVGYGYRLTASANAPDLSGSSISIYYLGSDVPPGEENWLRIYFWNGTSWRQLPTQLDTYHNFVSAPTQGPGLYALMSSIEIPLYGPGWDLFAYPVQATPLVTQALASIDGSYSTVYWYNGSDSTDPWKVYDVSVPPWVNDLSTFRFGEAYWISLTQSITLSLNGGSPSSPNRNLNVQSPPTTFYGSVLAGGDFTPTAGMVVTAWINGKMCGQGTTLQNGGDIVYSVNVFADGPGGASGCGMPGRYITFAVNGQSMLPRVEWNNDQVWNVPLSLAAITNLVAMNSSPTLLGQTTWFTVTATGDDITYSWSFGDGAPMSSGANVSHSYAAVGEYSALVTATNSVTSLATTTHVVIVSIPPHSVFLPLVQK